MTLTIRQQRILQALADSPTALSTRDLRRPMWMSPTEVRSACVWLRRRHYITQELRRVKHQAFEGWACKLMAFWSLTDKGEAYMRARAIIRMESGT